MRNFLFTLLLTLSQVAMANNGIEISILTCSPGQEVYSVFGHSSMRVVDHNRGTDEVYNFGMFNFNTPNFAYKFLKGQLQYYLDIQQTRDFIRIYNSEYRLVSEQRLQLTDEQEMAIISRLRFSHLPENRHYTYSFQDRNCSTELRDILVAAGVRFTEGDIDESTRDLVNSYLTDRPWLKFGINLIAGTEMDIRSGHLHSMFLPDYLQAEVGLASNQKGPLVSSVQDLNIIAAPKGRKFITWTSPLFIFSLLLGLFIFWFPKPLKILLCTALGLTGFILVLLWAFSGHPELKMNLNLLWCNPLYLLYLYPIIRNKPLRLLPKILIAGSILSLLVWLTGIQVFDISLLPLLGILAMFNLKQLRNGSTQTVVSPSLEV